MLFADHGLDAAAISSLFVVWSIVAFVSEVPSGAWADTVSRRGLLFTSGALLTAAFALWMVWPTYWGFAAGFVLWGISESLKSGTFEALVYDGLATLGAQHRYPMLMGWANAGEMTAVFVATLAAAPLYAIGGYALVGWMSVVIVAAGTALVATLPAGSPVADGDGDGPGGEGPGGEGTGGEGTAGDGTDGAASFVARYVATLRAGTAEVRTDRVVRRAVLLTAVLLACLAFDEYFGLLAREGGARTEHVPVLLALTVVGQVIGAATAGWTAQLNSRGMGAVIAVGAVTLAAGAAFGGAAGFAAIGLGYGAIHNAAIVSEARVQAAMSGRARATVTSVVGLASEVVSVAVYAGFALGSVWVPLWVLVVATAALLLGTGAVAVRWLPPAEHPADRV